MKRFLLWAFVCLSVMAHATVTITANLKDMTGTAVTTGSTVRLTLKGCSSNIPRVIGTGVFVSVDQDFTPDSVTGIVSMTVYKNSDITCGTTTGGTSYDFSILSYGTVKYRANYIFTVSADISSMTPTTSAPVVASPTGDNTYAQLSGGNMPFTGPITVPSMTAGNGTFPFLQPHVGSMDLKYQIDQSYNDRQFPFALQMVDGTAPASQVADDGTAAMVVHAIRGSDGTKPSMAFNPLVQCTNWVGGSCINTEHDCNNAIDGTAGGQGDCVLIISGWFARGFRALTIAGTRASDNGWQYGIDVHHTSEYGIKIGDTLSGGAGVGLWIAGNSNMQFSQLMSQKDSNFVKIVPTSDTDNVVWYVSNAADNAARAKIYKAGFQGDYFRTNTSNPADAGDVRLAKTGSVAWRNNANSANLLLGVDGSDRLTFGGNAIAISGIMTAGRINAVSSNLPITAASGTNTIDMNVTASSGTSGTRFGDGTGNVVASIDGTGKGTLTGISTGTAGVAGHATCWKTTTTISYCESVVAADGTCTCH